MRITIKDVAREANVSIATVSRVINRKDKVKEETRLKIMKAIEKLNFIPDYHARTMVQKKTKMIGFMPPELANGYWSELSDVIQDALWKKGYALLVASHNMDEEKINSILDLFQERNVDGIILGPLTSRKNIYLEKSIENLRNRRVALVTLQGNNIPGITSVDVDHLGGAMSAVQYLINSGHEKIAYIGAVSASREREFGYRNALTFNHIPINEEIVILTDYIENFTEFGYEAAGKLVSRKKFTAIFCGNDLIAFGVIKALKEMGVLIPEDVSIVGFDDISSSKIISPMLTTIKQPIKEIGSTVVDVLLDQMSAETGSITKKIVLPTELIIRET
ncbi:MULTISPECIES: LacI family DNA-binding transcriptional regulator [Metabacillus]|uniref:Uncharacterized protein n=2 Tax=Metabacillus TaxID=2675233 RepID=A0A179SR53_9BACI|nr:MULTISPECIES: LacI family DNA-binding transcriptional regulator [Metabacillus]OAS82783.1 hypothetical protein A6K24_11730 [Metabacillus litoralis]QNF30225.1 LacI family DNA-binding transcriptional regulator [Metabacillus sp. KUDC1714]